MILDLLALVGRANLAVAVAVVLVLLLRKPTRRAFGARAAYVLWLVPALAGAAALIPPVTLGGASTAAPVVATALAAAGSMVEATVGRAPRLPMAMLTLWIGGGLGMAVLLLSRQARFVWALGSLTPVAPRLYRAERAGTGPAVVGALFPQIVTPADFEARFAPHEREVVLAHEQAHLARGDAGVNALAAGVLCLCWFNPLVHLAVWFMRVDQELACDAAVLGRFPQARRLYAEVLLKTQLATQPLPFGCCWPAASEHPLKERITMLKTPLPASTRRLVGVGAAVVLSAAGAAVAWAAQPAPEPATAEGLRLAAASAPAPASAVVLPDWIAQPQGADVARFYPAAARAARQEGLAMVACRVDAEGRLGGCKAVAEAPAGAGFGHAALALAGIFRMKTVDENGRATAGQQIQIPFRFALPPTAAQ